MSKHRAKFNYRSLVFGEFYRVKNRWLFWWKPELKRRVKNVIR